MWLRKLRNLKVAATKSLNLGISRIVNKIQVFLCPEWICISKNWKQLKKNGRFVNVNVNGNGERSVLNQVQHKLNMI